MQEFLFQDPNSQNLWTVSLSKWFWKSTLQILSTHTPTDTHTCWVVACKVTWWKGREAVLPFTSHAKLKLLSQQQVVASCYWWHLLACVSNSCNPNPHEPPTPVDVSFSREGQKWSCRSSLLTIYPKFTGSHLKRHKLQRYDQLTETCLFLNFTL